jgi:uncharacterized damage-inducible protein DinB
MIPMSDHTGSPDTILELFADGPAQLEAVVAGLTDSELNLALSADSWTLRQIVHHIADGDDIWMIGIKAALGNPEGILEFKWYWDVPQNVWVERWKYASRPIESSLAIFRLNRQHITELIRQIPEAWELSLWVKWSNEEKMRMTVGNMVEMQARHAVHHIQDIQKIRQAHGPLTSPFSSRR